MEYYDVLDDLAQFPDAWCYVVFSRRGPGKTYSALKGAHDLGLTIAYTRRTKGDVQMISHTFNGKSMSPYEPIMRDHPEIRVRIRTDQHQAVATDAHVLPAPSDGQGLRVVDGIQGGVNKDVVVAHTVHFHEMDFSVRVHCL